MRIVNILVEEIKAYLKSWIKDGTPPNSFKDINFNNKIGVARKLIKLVDKKNGISDEIDNSFSSKSITYILGLYLYHDLTISKYRGELDSIRVKEPRIYQFLYKVLKLREDEPKILLSIFDYDIRDVIDETIDRDDYLLELFSTVGLTRLQNQDYLGYLELNNALLLIVADGVGGGEAGEVASKLAVDFIINDLKKSIQDNQFNHQSMQSLLRDTLYLANHKVVEYASEQNIGVIGTTLSLALIVDKINLYIAHIGDSRIYELDNSLEVRQITQDHSVREVLFRSNKITQDEKKEYNKSLLAFTLGKRNLKKENIFLQHSILYNSSRLILCSDGFWEKLEVTKETFTKPMDRLQIDIYNSIPTDNVTVIRYSPKVPSNIDIDDIYEEYEEEPRKKIERQSISYTTNRTFTKGKQITNRLNQLKNIVIILIIISSITFFILNFFVSKGVEVVKKDNNLTQLRGE